MGAPKRYRCYNFTAEKAKVNVGRVPQEWCNTTVSGQEIGPWARNGLYWYCGGLRLLARIETRRTVGVCAMVRLVAPLKLIGNKLSQDQTLSNTLTQRRKRHVLTKINTPSFGPEFNPTYMDAIGVPRGVPNEYKLADQIAAGFENIPLIVALIPITPNKNVDRINYVWYSLLRLTNHTRDGLEAAAEQLAPTSLMAVQNRMALDMLLAEKGGVCAMFGDLCCTTIPNNTAPDGSMTRSIAQLRALSKEMHENSGVDSPFNDWLESAFGKWKTLIMSILMSLAVFVGILVTCGCCCIPFLRAMMAKLITAALTKEKSPPPYEQFPLIQPDPEDEGELDNTAFETGD